MAENESLDLFKTRRWQRVYDAILKGRSASQLASLTYSCLRQTISALQKRILPNGPPQVVLDDLFDAVGDRIKMRELVRLHKGHDFAVLFHDSAICALTRENASESFLNAICDKYFDQIALLAIQNDHTQRFPRIRNQIEQAKAIMRPELENLAKQLAANPSKRLRRSRKVESVAIDTHSLLGESLLGLKRDCK